ncbi:SDR family NAD(P)-dependent oxidoreductase [Microbulbifer sp. EKSA008]|uniref:SDR family NAD(P)-dependent oxidoreductase n=1 Tax=Microbulbifer sp. EKSA008 TaxID=3243367 RepID=UPI00404214EF
MHAVLQQMKQRGSGAIVQISSILGEFVLPFLGSYNTTKHAIEGIGENYRVELAQFGIQSLIVQPGKHSFRTTVDGTGLNPTIEKVNKATEEAMQEIYSAYGMSNMFQLK